MTKAQQLRNIKGGYVCAAKYGKAHMAAIGRKGGLQPKAIVYQPLTENNDRRVPASLTELLQAVYKKQNLKQGGLKACHVKGS